MSSFSILKFNSKFLYFEINFFNLLDFSGSEPRFGPHFRFWAAETRRPIKAVDDQSRWSEIDG
jgi:hypothetical protein